MTENDAILIMDGSTRDDELYLYDAEDRPYLIARAENMALNALKEIQAYRAIGTVEELQSMKENGAFTGTELAQIAVCQMELQKYMAIGTIEEFKALKEKNEPKKPIERFTGNEWVCECPACRGITETPQEQIVESIQYCAWCGQKLDWQ